MDCDLCIKVIRSNYALNLSVIHIDLDLCIIVIRSNYAFNLSSDSLIDIERDRNNIKCQ